MDGVDLISTALVGIMGFVIFRIVLTLKNEIRAHKRDKSALEKSIKGLRDLQAAINAHAIVAITDVEGRITYVNDKFCETSKYSREELIGQDHRILNSGYHSKQHMKDMWDTISSGRVWHGEFKNKAKDGSFYWVRTTIMPFKDPKGKIYQYLAIRTDVTSLKEATDRLKEVNRQAKRIMEDLKKEKRAVELLSQKAEASARAKSNFLANMSHEIRTPMNAILGFSAMLQKTPLNDRQKLFVNTIVNSGELLLGIIDDILDISKLESGKVKLEDVAFSLEDLIVEAFKMVVARVKDRGFESYIDIHPDVPVWVKSDPIRLKQILVNLLGNAAKFTDQGSIGVIVRPEPSQERDPAETCRLRFTVKDTGTGIPADKKEVIFESFSQADESITRRFGGTGLGLAISKALVKAFGGEIWVESEEGRGSEFIFTIRTRRLAGKDRAQVPVEIKTKKVLIVDDSHISRKILQRSCERMGMKVLGVADSPQAALHKLDKLLDSRGLRPDLVLCDIMMEGMSGYELVQKMRAKEGMDGVKYIAITGELGADLLDQAQEAGFQAYVNKPINQAHLLTAIKGVFGGQPSQDIPKNEDSKIGEGVKVLVVEDSSANRMLIQVYFEQLGCQGDYVSNGREAVDRLRQGHRYDLCLMDLQMPVMDGLEAASIIRKEISRDLPIIALTAAVMASDQKKVKESGMNGFLAKPVDLEKVKHLIAKYKK